MLHWILQSDEGIGFTERANRRKAKQSLGIGFGSAGAGDNLRQSGAEKDQGSCRCATACKAMINALSSWSARYCSSSMMIAIAAPCL